MKVPVSPEPIERMVNYDEWFWAEVQKDIAAADRGEVTDHGEVRKLIGERSGLMRIDFAVRILRNIRRDIEGSDKSGNQTVAYGIS